MTSRRRRPLLRCRSSAAMPLDDDDLLSEILLRLPPLPSSLPRASAVCKRWRCLASDPAFSRRFRIHHRRNPPLLGCFHGGIPELCFQPTMAAPNRVPSGRLSLQFKSHVRVLGCRHGLVLILDQTPQLLVWDPVTGHQHLLAYPPEFDLANSWISGAVLRSAAGEVHFQVVLVVSEYEKKLLACVYSSETGAWGTLISTPIPSGNSLHTRVCWEHAVLVGDSLYWILAGTTLFNLLEFDLKTESLTVIPLPADKSYDAVLNSPEGRFTVMRAEGGGLGLLSVSGFTAQLWKRKTDFDGVASWGMGRTVELDELLSMDSKDYLDIEGYAEDNNLVFLWTGRSLFTVKLEPLQCNKLFDTNNRACYYPFEAVYATGT
ncbi:hypothetical protein CFC21_086523 [Triticum aestivum]|uniref:Uncharacterized protein n=2 Tax=Triticum aestivum TaxID=4565 RepID=A0A3B6PHZ4_WHEAT|nr:putative F-box/kelch-repeat protein At3g22730 isoform X3 [Triticum aestivum]XP_044410887.1 putative F-box/kelch-repeat protein At3g22730 isoform X3 [Triticum aestivum]XP_044410888.1 putative F-box/kelch-repeat protein At3g22730 isoform X3 [Triticum aestivum]KAF7082667.1 hypothetical protein CFC21_086523 [Triticum aestivum]